MEAHAALLEIDRFVWGLGRRKYVCLCARLKFKKMRTSTVRYSSAFCCLLCGFVVSGFFVVCGFVVVSSFHVVGRYIHSYSCADDRVPLLCRRPLVTAVTRLCFRTEITREKTVQSSKRAGDCQFSTALLARHGEYRLFIQSNLLLTVDTAVQHIHSRIIS